MSKKPVRTIAFQVYDWDFLKEYDQRQQESGLSVKDYFISLIKADIAMNPTQKDSPTQDGGVQTVTGAEQAADITLQQTQESPAPEQDADALSEDTVINDADAEDQEQAVEPVPQQNQPDTPAVSEEMMNLFVKITRDQRESLEAHKNETGETVGGVLNRIIDDFLNHTDSLPEGFEEAFQRYSQNPKLCDTTASAKIPAQTNRELTDYLDSFGGSRNALMATLVDLELKGQEMTETQDEDQGMSMT
jgi:hypothetical protein